MRILSALSVLAAVVLSAAAPQDHNDSGRCSYVVDLAASDAGLVKELQKTENFSLRIEADRYLFLQAQNAMCTFLSKLPTAQSRGDINPKHLYVVPAHDKLPGLPKVRTLITGGRFSLVEMRREIPKFYDGDDFKGTMQQVTGSQILARRWVTSDAQKNDVDGYHPEVVAAFDQDAWYDNLKTLVTWNRNTSQKGNLLARDYLAKQFTDLGMEVTTPAFKVGGTTTYNVVGKIFGKSRPNEVYIVGAHYDTTSENTSQSAPGAEDNGSGTAALLAMARVFTQTPPEATIIFIAFSGEEQGLYGSKDYVAKLTADNMAKIKRVIIMDMIAYTTDEDLDCLLETHERNASFVAELADAAAKFTKLRIVTSYNYWGSDHVPFINKNVPTVLTIENDYDDYPSYHRTTDTLDKVSVEMGAETIKMNIAALTKWVY